MTGRFSTRRTGPCLLALLIASCCLSNKVFVVGEPEPIPAELLNENFISNAENFIMLNKLRQLEMKEKEEMVEREKALYDMQMVMNSLEARAKAEARAQQADYSIEELPTPNAVVSQVQRSGKRTATSYVTLCHFKICNMGRKRQLHK